MVPGLSRDCARAAAVTLLLATRGWGAPPDAEVADAARRQDRETVRALLAGGADTNARQPDGATALHWAVHWQDVDMAALLIKAGADVDAANDYGIVPLSLACSNGDAAAARLLLEAGANPNVAQPTGETPALTAARTGDVDVLRALIEHGADVNGRERQQQQTPLMWAIAAGHTAAARLLLDRAADPRARSTRGDTALLFAARDGNVDSALMLLDAGADIEEAAADGFTPLLVATVRGRTAVATLLLERGANPNHAAPGFTALHWASGVWETELTGPRGIAAQRDEEWRALGGITEGKPEFVRALLADGADPNARIVKPPQRVGFTLGGLNLVGATPYLVAAAAGDAAVMRLLAQAGADPALTTKAGHDGVDGRSRSRTDRRGELGQRGAGHRCGRGCACRRKRHRRGQQRGRYRASRCGNAALERACEAAGRKGCAARRKEPAWPHAVVERRGLRHRAAPALARRDSQWRRPIAAVIARGSSSSRPWRHHLLIAGYFRCSRM